MRDKKFKRKTFWLVAASGTMAAILCAAGVTTFPDPPAAPSQSNAGLQKAVFAGGCFWGVEAVFEQLNGVTNVTAGYAGGRRATAQYETVSSGMTGHAESVQVTYNPDEISYGQLLKVFFAVAHDPTELNRQGPDSGTQYRSAIFYLNDAQRDEAKGYIHLLDQSKVFRKPIVTEVTRLAAFYPAESYHQKFVQRNPGYPYVVVNDLPKLEQLRRQFPELLAHTSAQSK